MKAADVIVSKAGGLIVSESLACGLPMILFDVIPGQETGNANFVIENGAGTLVETQMGMLETLSHLLANNGSLIEKQSMNSRKLGHPSSAYLAADLVHESLTTRKRLDIAEKSSRKPRLIDLLSKNKIPWQDNPFKLILPK